MRYSDLSGFKNMKPHTTKKIKHNLYFTNEQKYISYVVFTIKS